MLSLEQYLVYYKDSVNTCIQKYTLLGSGCHTASIFISRVRSCSFVYSTNTNRTVLVLNLFCNPGNPGICSKVEVTTRNLQQVCTCVLVCVLKQNSDVFVSCILFSAVCHCQFVKLHIYVWVHHSLNE